MDASKKSIKSLVCNLHLKDLLERIKKKQNQNHQAYKWGSEFNRIIASFHFKKTLEVQRPLKIEGFHQVDYFLGGIFNHPKLGLLFFFSSPLDFQGI